MAPPSHFFVVCALHPDETAVAERLERKGRVVEHLFGTLECGAPVDVEDRLKYCATSPCGIDSPASRFSVTAKSDQFRELTNTAAPSMMTIFMAVHQPVRVDVPPPPSTPAVTAPGSATPTSQRTPSIPAWTERTHTIWTATDACRDHHPSATCAINDSAVDTCTFALPACSPTVGADPSAPPE